MSFGIYSRKKLSEFLANDPWPGHRVTLQGLDLTDFADQLLKLDLSRFSFFGCQLPPVLLQAAAHADCVVFPCLRGRYPFQPFRSEEGLYCIEELFDHYRPDQPGSHLHCRDSIIFETVFETAPDGSHRRREDVPLETVMARRIHDSSITYALEQHILDYRKSQGERARVIAIMGSHSLARRSQAYGDVARIAHRLTRGGVLILSGGGPGLMEAANLGAFLARLGEADFEAELGRFQAVPFEPQVREFLQEIWFSSAWELRQRILAGVGAGSSLGVPTWFYGHEPPNFFATLHAKYFENSPREEGLLALATEGVIFAQGSAGTVQEIFQDCCQNYYTTYGGVKSPMVLLGENYWTEELPAYPLLQRLAEKGGFADRFYLSSEVAQVIQIFLKNTPAALS